MQKLNFLSLSVSVLLSSAGCQNEPESKSISKETPSNKMIVEIWSDVMCPFCYIGKRKFEAALAQFPGRDNVEIVWEVLKEYFELFGYQKNEWKNNYER